VILSLNEVTFSRPLQVLPVLNYRLYGRQHAASPYKISKWRTSTLLAYPNPRLPFNIEADACDYQLESIISQNPSLSSINTIIKIFLETSTSTITLDFRPIAFFSRKLSSAQRNYTTLEKRLLSMVETLVEYRTILYSNKFFVFTDHRNLTFNCLSSQRALRLRLLAEEYNITIIFRPGASNLAADAISLLPLRHTEEPLAMKELEMKFDDSYFNLPIQTIISPNFSLHFSTIRQHQQNDPSLQRLPTSSPSHLNSFPSTIPSSHTIEETNQNSGRFSSQLRSFQ